MKPKYVFTGTVKRCHDVYWFNEYGDQRYVPDFRIGNIEVGSIRQYADVVDKEAVLVKVDDSQYVWLDMVKTLADEVKIDLGISNLVIYGKPFFNGALFVDEDTLFPYFKNPVDTKMSMHRLRKTIYKSHE